MAETDHALDALAGGTALDAMVGKLGASTASLAGVANNFAAAMVRAFALSSVSGKQFDDVLRNVALRMSSLSVAQAFVPLSNFATSGLTAAFSGLLSGGFPKGLAAATGAIKPFASGGVIGTPTYFPMSNGGLGLAGEAGPEAIMPLRRGPDGRLGVATSGGSSANVTVHIATPDAASFRRSEAYVTGQIARAVARGQRSM